MIHMRIAGDWRAMKSCAELCEKSLIFRERTLMGLMRNACKQRSKGYNEEMLDYVK